MGKLVAAMGTVHAPQLFVRPPSEDPAQLDADIAAMRLLGKDLDEAKPDVAIVIGNDHMETFFLTSEESFHVIVADHNRHIGLGFIKVLAEQAHRGNVGIELCWILTRWPHKELRGMHGPHRCYKFSHDDYLTSAKSGPAQDTPPLRRTPRPWRVLSAKSNVVSGRKPTGGPVRSRTMVASQLK